MLETKDVEGQITQTNYRKSDDETSKTKAKKRPGGCVDCVRCGECGAILGLEELRRQDSVVTRISTRVLELLEKAIALK